MASQMTIPITDHAANCTAEYIVRYKLASDQGYQVLTPRPYTSPIVIPDLKDGQNYTVSIIRVGCNGIQSEATTFNKST